MPLKRHSFRNVQQTLKAGLKQAHRDKMALDPVAGIVERERAETRINVFEELCRYYDVALIPSKMCQRGGCVTVFPNLGACRKYCSDACRQAAYRSRRLYNV